MNEADRDSARQREVKSGDSRTPRILALLITLGFFGMLGIVCFHQLPAGTQDAAMLLLGALGASWTSVVAYYFGSSAGSSTRVATSCSPKARR